jgi:hypothetical protein
VNVASATGQPPRRHTRVIARVPELTESGGLTSVVFRQEDPRPSSPEASSGEEEAPDVLTSLNELVEKKMP